jgi:hypothetical protein
MGDRHRFEPNILKLSQADNISDALQEWYFFSQERVPHKTSTCVCNSNITIVHTYLNSKTGQACLLGGNCHRKMKAAARRNGNADSRTCMEFEPTTYTEITDMVAYSSAILEKILADIRNKVLNTYIILELQEYKRFILTFAIDTSEVVQLINGRIQQRSVEIERIRLDRERLEHERLQALQRQREIAAEQRRIMQEAARVAAQQEIERKKQEVARKIFEQQREKARREAELEQQRLITEKMRAERAAQDLIREEERRIARIERDKKEAAEREEARLKQLKIAAEKKKKLDESFNEFCICKNAVFKMYHPDDDGPRCKTCKRFQQT